MGSVETLALHPHTVNAYTSRVFTSAQLMHAFEASLIGKGVWPVLNIISVCSQAHIGYSVVRLNPINVVNKQNGPLSIEDCPTHTMCKKAKILANPNPSVTSVSYRASFFPGVLSRQTKQLAALRFVGEQFAKHLGIGFLHVRFLEKMGDDFSSPPKLIGECLPLIVQRPEETAERNRITPVFPLAGFPAPASPDKGGRAVSRPSR